MTASFDPFAEGFAAWRRTLAAMREQVPEVQWTAFEDAVKEVATYVGKGCDKARAADELHEMASAYGVANHYSPDDVQHLISDAFDLIEHVPDYEEVGPNGNGRAGEDHAKAKAKAPAPTATVYIFPEQEMIPKREWLYEGHYVRGAATATVAPGGWGKTTLTLFELIMMAQEGLNVWYLSGEDPRVEIDRRIAAHMEHHRDKVQTLKITGHLFVDDKESFAFTIGRSPRTSTVTFDEGWLHRFEQEIVDKKIDVVALDPFISFHTVPEGDNGAIDAIVKRLSQIAARTMSCIEISHHVRKAQQGPAIELTIDDTRGGSAIVNAARSVRVINRMNANEAAVAKVGPDVRSQYVRVDKGKRNMAPPEHAKWFRIKSVWLRNGDNVQAIEPYEYKGAFDGMSDAEIDWVQTLLRDRPRRASSQSDDWLGHDIGIHVGRETHEKEGAIWANKVIGEWLRNKVFKKLGIRDPETRKPNVPFYVANDYVPKKDGESNVLPFGKNKAPPPEAEDQEDDDED